MKHLRKMARDQHAHKIRGYASGGAVHHDGKHRDPDGDAHMHKHGGRIHKADGGPLMGGKAKAKPHR